MQTTPTEYKGWNIEGIAGAVLKEMLEDANSEAAEEEDKRSGEEVFDAMVESDLEYYVHRVAYLSVYTKDMKSAQTVAGMVREFIEELENPFEFATAAERKVIDS
ncbi:MAG: hypothetical protein ACYC69_02915 [Thermodesulfovibrionales bacterium]